MRNLATRAALAAVFFAAAVLAHGDDESADMDMDMDMGMNSSAPTSSESVHPNSEGPMSYFAYGKHRGTVMAHVGLMIAAWCFLLPTGMCKLGITLKTFLS